MNRTTLISVIVALVVVAAGAYYWYAILRATPEERTLEEAVDLLVESAGSALPVIDPSVNPVGETPDVNPLTNTNPFTGVKTNPFSP